MSGREDASERSGRRGLFPEPPVARELYRERLRQRPPGLVDGARLGLADERVVDEPRYAPAVGGDGGGERDLVGLTVADRVDEPQLRGRADALARTPQFVEESPATHSMPGIFISYRRRDDSLGFVRPLSDKLTKRFGEDQIFRDITGIDPGERFRKILKERLTSCSIMLVLIGRRWLAEPGRDGGPNRLCDPNDWVRIEIETAIARDIVLIPVCVAGAELPPIDQLPDTVKPLLDSQGLPLDAERHWDADTDRLVDVLIKKHGLAPVVGPAVPSGESAQGLADAAPATSVSLPTSKGARASGWRWPAFFAVAVLAVALLTGAIWISLPDEQKVWLWCRTLVSRLDPIVVKPTGPIRFTAVGRKPITILGGRPPFTCGIDEFVDGVGVIQEGKGGRSAIVEASGTPPRSTHNLLIVDDCGAAAEVAVEIAFDATRSLNATTPVPSDVAAARRYRDLDKLPLGALSERWESNGNPSAVGYAFGGWSYGLYQFDSRTGKLSKFLKFLQRTNPVFFAPLAAAGGEVAAAEGRADFVAAWKKLADDPEFSKAQRAFVRDLFYEPAVTILRDAGFDPTGRSATVQNVVWSTVVQFGPAGGAALIKRALATLDAAGLADDAKVISAIYAERSRFDMYFPQSTEQVRSAVLQRYREEQLAALQSLTKDDDHAQTKLLKLQNDQYPNFAAFLRDDLPRVPEQLQVWKALLASVPLPEIDIRRALEPYGDPRVFVEKLDTQLGYFDATRPRVITIASRLVDAFERNPSDPALRADLERTLLHQIVHWAWAAAGHQEDRESGLEFEKSAYGS